MTPHRPAKKFLIVDDDALDGSIAETSIHAAADRAEVVIVGRSDEAVDQFKTFMPDFTLIDIHMPGIDGFGILEQIAGSARAIGSRIIMLSGSHSVRDRMRAYEAGADEYIIKPASLAEYRTMAKRLVAQTA